MLHFMYHKQSYNADWQLRYRELACIHFSGASNAWNLKISELTVAHVVLSMYTQYNTSFETTRAKWPLHVTIYER